MKVILRLRRENVVTLMIYCNSSVSPFTKWNIRCLFVDPRSRVRGPGVDTLWEPQGDLLLGILHRVGAVADVSPNIDGEVASNGSGGRLTGLGGSEHLAASGNGTLAFPDHAAHRARDHVADEPGEEGSRGKVGCRKKEGNHESLKHSTTKY